MSSGHSCLLSGHWPQSHGDTIDIRIFCLSNWKYSLETLFPSINCKTHFTKGECKRDTFANCMQMEWTQPIDGNIGNKFFLGDLNRMMWNSNESYLHVSWN